MDNSVCSTFATREHCTVDDVRSHLERSRVVLFGRGSEENPRCGYTKDAISALQSSGCNYKVIDIVEDPSVTAALRAYVGPVSLPAMFVDGELVGTPENLPALIATGALDNLVRQ